MDDGEPVEMDDETKAEGEEMDDEAKAEARRRRRPKRRRHPRAVTRALTRWTRRSSSSHSQDEHLALTRKSRFLKLLLPFLAMDPS